MELELRLPLITPRLKVEMFNFSVLSYGALISLSQSCELSCGHVEVASQTKIHMQASIVSFFASIFTCKFLWGNHSLVTESPKMWLGCAQVRSMQVGFNSCTKEVRLRNVGICTTIEEQV